MSENHTSPAFPITRLGYLFATICALSVVGLLFGWGSASALVTVTVVTAGALLLMTVLPQLSSFKFGPTGVEATVQQIIENKITPITNQVEEQKVRVNKQGEVLAEQQKIINDLVVYSLAEQPYEILWRLMHTPEYIYRDTDNMRRWLNTLLDSGYIEPKSPGGWLEFNAQKEGSNLVELAKPTPAGEFLISLRQKPHSARVGS